VNVAKTIKKTIYVVSKDGLYAVDPAGNVTRVYNSISDVGDRKKKANVN
jgi:hypothetical protein